MKISDIQSGIPAPKGVSKYNPFIFVNTERMEINQSFCITLENEEQLSIRGLSAVINRRSKNKKFKCAKESENKIRIWRIK